VHPRPFDDSDSSRDNNWNEEEEEGTPRVLKKKILDEALAENPPKQRGLAMRYGNSSESSSDENDEKIF
jgi:hypothetical protein